MHIQKKIDDDRDLYLLTVIESKGSAPGRRGFMMIVDDANELYGSIGGGIMEYKLVEKAKNLLKQKKLHSFCIKQIHRGDAQSSSGMICSGEQTIAFTPLSKKQQDLVLSLADAAMIEITQHGIQPIADLTEESCLIESDLKWYYTQRQQQSKTVHLFGAGHVSVPTSELLNKLGFQVRLYDNRQNINTYRDNHWVVSKQIVDYSHIHQSIVFAENDYIVLMTHKFTEDKLILSQLLNEKCAYLGVLGSKNKIKVMFNALIKEKYKQDDLDKVYAPIGLDIHSQTTTEIAVSIVAQVIKINNG
ncbi:MAG: XdhC family protein [Marinicellaceae bacterium]